ncbi:hypothetical protein K439DRAFT_1611589 [Ramaria rubella]|nr:hypothetical protein K439DRAFT_1611589 [Ramaria rubella]
MAKKSKGGQPLNQLIEANFCKHSQLNNKLKQWLWQCCHCPKDAKPIEHHKKNLLRHLTNPKACLNALVDIVAEAHRCMMTKGKVSAARITFKESTVGSSSSATSVIVINGDKEPDSKKRRQTLTLNKYVEQALTESEKSEADVALVQ